MEKDVLLKKSMAVVLLFVMIFNVVGMSYPTYAITSSDETAQLYVDRFELGGEEKSGILNDLSEQERAYYDTTRYAYKIGDKSVYKILVNGDSSNTSALYCVEQSKEFPGIDRETNAPKDPATYNNAGDFKDTSRTAVNTYISDLPAGRDAYDALVRMLNSFYLKNQAPEQKILMLKNAFEDAIDDGYIDNFDFDDVKIFLTDDDIETVQQYAIWFFTEQSEDSYRENVESFTTYKDNLISGRQYIELPAVNREVESGEGDSIDNLVKLARLEMMSRLYTYYLACGLGLNDFNGYGGEETTVTLWVPEESRNQRVILIERKPNVKADLALRKFVSAISKDAEISDDEFLSGSASREPVVDYSKLDAGERNTAIYNQSKTPVEIEAGDYILYTIRIYNEGVVDAKAASIVDYLPDGLEFVPGSEENVEEGTIVSLINDIWTYDSETGKVSTNNKYVPEVVSAHETGKDLSYKDVQILCRVKENATATSNFLNLAEITKVTDKDDNPIPEEDSTPDDVTYPDNPDTYDGGDSPDKSDDYKPGQEDDDDFDRVTLKSEFDLAIRKFVAGVSKDDDEFEEGEYLTDTGKADGKYDREPEVDTSKLNTIGTDGKKITTAVYKHSKTPVKVEKGDIVLYQIRVYNEGNVTGYADEITDYLPEYLEFLPENEINRLYGWREYVGNSQKIFTNYLSKENEQLIVAFPADYTPEKYPYYTSSTTNLLAYTEYMKEGPHYRVIEVACKVKDASATNTNITNIAEATKTVDENGKVVIDRDSVTNNLNYPSDPSKYEGQGNQNGYYPGQQDDDDFDRVIVEDNSIVDLALRKYIVKAASKAEFDKTSPISGADPVVDYSKLDSGEAKTAIYKHSKNAIKVSAEDYVLYRIRIYNEGNIDAKATQIVDYLPEGLEFVEGDVNKIWTYNKETRKVTTNDNYKAELIAAHEKGKALSYKDVEIVCQVSKNAKENTNITNIAEIAKITDKDGNVLTDRDSNPNNLNYPSDPSKYEGQGNQNGYYPGQQDDDDFARVLIEPAKEPEKIYDLALRKFISAVSKDEKFETSEYLTGNNSMAPTVNYSKLDNGTSKDATYTMKKTSVNVEPTNYILYTIRIYNEGPEDAIAAEITDILPEGLEFVSGHSANSIWTYNSATRKIVTNNNYKPAAIKGHVSGKDLFYVDISVVCRVSSTAKTGTDLKNVAEITKMTDKDGNKVTDRDSTPGNYNPNGKNNQEDDDDYALINVLKTETPPSNPPSSTTPPSSNPPSSTKPTTPTTTPATGDMIPLAAGLVIVMTVVVNMIQVTIEKKKEN